MGDKKIRSHEYIDSIQNHGSLHREKKRSKDWARKMRRILWGDWKTMANKVKREPGQKESPRKVSEEIS